MAEKMKKVLKKAEPKKKIIKAKSPAKKVAAKPASKKKDAGGHLRVQTAEGWKRMMKKKKEGEKGKKS